MALHKTMARRIGRLYFIAIALIALLTLVSQGYLQSYLYNLSFDSREINLAGKMRMLSQRTVKLALLVRDDEDNAAAHREALEATSAEFFDIFHALANGSDVLRVQPPHSGDAVELFKLAAPLLNRTLEAADQLRLAAPGSPAFNRSLDILIDNDEPLLTAIARIPTRYDELAKQQVQRLEWIELGLMCLTLTVLLLELRFIFRPIIQIAMEAIAQVEADAIEAQRLRRLASMGEMSGGIAHELNSPLAALSFAIQRLQRRLKRNRPLEPADLSDQLDKMSDDALRMGEIVQSVRALAAGKLPEPKKALHADAVLRRVEQEFRLRYGSKDRPIKILPGAEAVIVLAVGYQIEQVLLNLIKNASEALSGIEEPWIELSARANEEGTHFVVRDAGTGIPPDVVERIYDPFYSTKGIGGGMGLGLALCQKLIELHQGRLHYELLDGHTAFVITLPAGHDQETP